ARRSAVHERAKASTTPSRSQASYPAPASAPRDGSATVSHHRQLSGTGFRIRISVVLISGIGRCNRIGSLPPESFGRVVYTLFLPAAAPSLLCSLLGSRPRI